MREETRRTPWGERPARHRDHAPLGADWKKIEGRVEHTFTHFHLEIEVWKAKGVLDGELRDDGDYRWVRREELAGEALPTVMRKIVAHVLKN